jgi:hypothetical protein
MQAAEKNAVDRLPGLEKNSFNWGLVPMAQFVLFIFSQFICPQHSLVR